MSLFSNLIFTYEKLENLKEELSYCKFSQEDNLP